MQATMQQDQSDHKQRNHALRFVLAQLIVTLIISALLLIIGYTSADYTNAYSAFLGGLIATLANGWFALKVFRSRKVDHQIIHQPEKAAETLLATFYTGEIYKFIFTGAMFVIVFKLITPISVIALLATYFLIHLTPAAVNFFVVDDMKSDASN